MVRADALPLLAHPAATDTGHGTRDTTGSATGHVDRLGQREQPIPSAPTSRAAEATHRTGVRQARREATFVGDVPYHNTLIRVESLHGPSDRLVSIACLVEYRDGTLLPAPSRCRSVTFGLPSFAPVADLLTQAAADAPHEEVPIEISAGERRIVLVTGPIRRIGLLLLSRGRGEVRAVSLGQLLHNRPVAARNSRSGAVVVMKPAAAARVAQILRELDEGATLEDFVTSEGCAD